MNDKQLKTLITTVECGSFTKAEELLFLSKQAIKKQIDSLEEELGFSLLLRTHQGITLTPAGQEFCKHISKTLKDIDSIIYRCKMMSTNEQVIRIESPHHPRLLLENVLAEFHRKFPEIKQQIIQQPSSQFVSDILEGRTDIAEHYYNPKLENSELRYMKLYRLTFNCLVAPSHPLADKESICLEELVGCNIGLHRNNGELLAQMKNDYGLSPELMENDMQAISNLCFNGGIFISKAYFLNSMQPLIAIPLETDLAPTAAILYRSSPSLVVREFLAVAREMYPAP